MHVRKEAIFMTKTALVTGANKGIGYEIAKNLLQQGYTVLVGARNVERGEKAVSALKSFGDVHLQIIDVSNITELPRIAKEIIINYPDFSLLVNNAGIPGDMSKPAWEFTVAELQATHVTDFIGPYELSRSLLPILEKNEGQIFNVTIPIEPVNFFHPFAYMSAKAPLNILTKTWGLEFKAQHKPVEIFALMPGGVTTDLNNNLTGPGFKTPQAAGKLAVSLITDHINRSGQVVNFDGKIANYA